MPPLPFPEITWGVELEFMAKPPPNAPKGLGRRVLTRRAVAQHLTLATKLLPSAYQGQVNYDGHHSSEGCATCMFEPSGQCKSPIHMTSEWPEQVSIRPGTKFWSNVCLIQDEILHEPYLAEVNRERSWPHIEITTPIFDTAELRKGMPALSEVLTALRNMDVDITADQSCGLHVHIGLPTGLTLDFAKKMVVLVTALEDALLRNLTAPGRRDSMYAWPIHRKSNMTLTEAKPSDSFHMSEEDYSALREMTLALPQISPSEFCEPGLFTKLLDRIWNASSLDNLADLIMNHEARRIGMAISLRDNEGMRREPMEECASKESTIEFRYLQMSFDKDLIKHWVEILCKLTGIALKEGNDFMACYKDIRHTLDREASATTTPAWELILRKVLKLEHRIPAWRKHIKSYEAGDIAFLDDDLLLTRETRGRPGGAMLMVDERGDFDEDMYEGADILSSFRDTH
ncbi:hypothetical protein BGZ63DRAFT_402905 [Mariannaea sp. PMI_226]|nr:hypothetical protein BGZ63DRAFT_402905 [Mariannaea sp. PMI_226]